jgi:hypothetical protein
MRAMAAENKTAPRDGQEHGMTHDALLVWTHRGDGCGLASRRSTLANASGGYARARIH